MYGISVLVKSPIPKNENELVKFNLISYTLIISYKMAGEGAFNFGKRVLEAFNKDIETGEFDELPLKQLRKAPVDYVASVYSNGKIISLKPSEDKAKHISFEDWKKTLQNEQEEESNSCS